MHLPAELMPPMSADGFDDLVQSIAIHRQWDPGIPFDGRLLDDKNRRVACAQLGIPLRVGECTGWATGVKVS